jgi:hypothetical protein
VDEHVERGERGRQVGAAEASGEVGTGEVASEPLPLRPLTDHDQPGPGEPGHGRQAAYLLLGGQSAHVAHEQVPPAPGQRGVPDGVAPIRSEEVERDPAPPQVEVADAEPAELVVRGPRRDQGPVGSPVQPADPPVQHDVGTDAVVTGEPGDVGLVDGDRGDAEPPRRTQPGGTDDERRGEVDHVGGEVGQRPLDRSVREADREGAVAGQADRTDPGHRDAEVVRGSAPGGHHERLVAEGPQLLGDVADRVGDPVDLGQEGLRDEGDAHDPTVAPPDERPVIAASVSGDGWTPVA